MYSLLLKPKFLWPHEAGSDTKESRSARPSFMSDASDNGKTLRANSKKSFGSEDAWLRWSGLAERGELSRAEGRVIHGFGVGLREFWRLKYFYGI